MKFSISHISPHLGGGVGRVLLSYFRNSKNNKIYRHSIYSLDTINKSAKESLLNNKINFEESLSFQHDKLLKVIESSNIVIIHWWNHPLLYEFLIKNSLPKARVIIWSHVSGLYAPQLFTKALFNYPDLFIFTTPISYKSEEFILYKGDKNRFRDIWATRDFEIFNTIKHKKQKEFTIGYIGTVDFSKMYPQFLYLCENINIPNVKFIICGEGSDLTNLKKEVKSKGIEHKFLFTGFVENVQDYLELFDIFMYPLNKKHYGTCDQVLAEAMTSGIVPVVFNNMMEKNMIQHEYSGIIASNNDEYIDAIIKLFNDSSLRRKLSENAKGEALKKFNITSTISKWEIVYKELLQKPKKKRKWVGSYSGKEVKGFEIFLESIGKYSKIFKSKDINKIRKLYTNKNWVSQTKGTVYHYNSFFKEKQLKDWYLNEE